MFRNNEKYDGCLKLEEKLFPLKSSNQKHTKNPEKSVSKTLLRIFFLIHDNEASKHKKKKK